MLEALLAQEQRHYEYVIAPRMAQYQSNEEEVYACLASSLASSSSLGSRHALTAPHAWGAAAAGMPEEQEAGPKPAGASNSSGCSSSGGAGPASAGESDDLLLLPAGKLALEEQVDSATTMCIDAAANGEAVAASAALGLQL